MMMFVMIMNLHPLASGWLYWVKGVHMQRSGKDYMYSTFGWSTIFITCEVVCVERETNVSHQ